VSYTVNRIFTNNKIPEENKKIEPREIILSRTKNHPVICKTKSRGIVPYHQGWNTGLSALSGAGYGFFSWKIYPYPAISPADNVQKYVETVITKKAETIK